MRTEAAISRSGAAVPVLEAVDLEAPRSGELLIRVIASGICHTDLGVHAGRGPGTALPAVLGHEGAGVVIDTGPGVTGLKVGDHVVLSGSSCGHCPSCLRNYPSYCREAMPRNFGGQRMDGSSALSQNGLRLGGHFFGQSSFARHCIATERTAVRVPADLPLELLGPLGCGVITGAGAILFSLGVKTGQSVAVFGAGGVGLSAVMAARLVGAREVIAIDKIAARLELARQLGATHTIDVGAPDVVQQIIEITRGGVDRSLNTTRAPAVFTAAMQCLAMQGVAGFVAAPAMDWQPAMFPMLAGGRRLQGILGGDAAPQSVIPMLVDYYRQGRLPFDGLLRFYAFEDIGKAFHDMEQGEVIKPVLRMAA
ncbi:MAG TPA: NAD(P)-dependent alcohol dehydrogenase [Steroidobacteraceae bacterium]|nr:NAD(P)-dependent alcohol dehydrogenase [Steroidobacteraceae bacterium]